MLRARVLNGLDNDGDMKWMGGLCHLLLVS